MEKKLTKCQMKEGKLTESKIKYRDLLSLYADEYMEELGEDDDILIPMEDFDEVMSGAKPFEIAKMTFYGGVYRDKKQSFNPNCDYFIFDGYGNFMGVFDTSLENYYDDFIRFDEFILWCEEQGYLAEEDEKNIVF